MIEMLNIQKQTTTVMTEHVFKWWDYLIFAVLTMVIYITFTYFFVYWFSLWNWQYAPVPFVLITAGLLLFLDYWCSRYCLDIWDNKRAHHTPFTPRMCGYYCVKFVKSSINSLLEVSTTL
jgi:hypothetical protein